MSATVAPGRAATSTSRSRAVSGETPPASVAAASAGSTTRPPVLHPRIAPAGGGGGRPGGGRARRQRRIYHTLARHDPPDRVSELFGRCVLDHESAGAGLHRAPQVPGAAERGEDERTDRKST